MGISILATLLWSDQEISYNSTSTEKMKCPNCGKEVYHAECVRSLNKDWHRACLKCEHCGKTQSAGGHAEHEGNHTVTHHVMQNFLDQEDLVVVDVKALFMKKNEY